jgi:NitT/TauT family transport system substrate-binding protein
MKGTVTMLVIFFILLAVPLGTLTAQEVDISIAALRGPTGMGMIKLFEEKPVYGSGVEASYEIAGSPDILVSKIISEEVDIASMPTNLAAKLYAKGVEYKLGAVTGYGVLYVLGRDVSIETFEELEGKTIYNVGRAATPEFILRYILSEHGLDPQDDVTIEFRYKHPELAQLFIAGRVDLGVLPEPFVTKVLENNPDVRVLFDLQKEWARLQGTKRSYPMSCVLIRKGLIQEHPGIAKKYLEEYRESIDWVKEHPGEAGKLSEKHGIGMDASTAEAAIPRLNLHFKSAASAQGEVKTFLRILHSFDPQSVGGALPGDDFYMQK